jgi:NADPH-dependent curcumin reductase CurA
MVELNTRDTVLYHADEGGLGQILLQQAKSLGLRVVAMVSKEAKVEVVCNSGCDAVFNYRTEVLWHVLSKLRAIWASRQSSIQSARTRFEVRRLCSSLAGLR